MAARVAPRFAYFTSEDCMLVVSSASRQRRTRRVILSSAFAGAAVAALSIAACSSDTEPATPREVDGAAVTVGQGTARTFVVTGPDGASSIGVALTPQALDGLPSVDSMWSLPLPAGEKVAPYDHVEINWNAHGHPPAVYGIPHFDFHFYTVSTAAQAAIQPGPDTVTVPSPNVPPNYVSGVQAVPDMGVHWVDTLSAEFQGHVFDHTLIYGFYHGAMVFLEPMVTRDFLASQPNVSLPVKQPLAFQQPGSYPSRYSVRFDAATSTIRVSLDSLAVH